MPGDMHVEVVNLHRSYAAIKAIGDGALRRELTRAIRDATKPMREEVKASELEHLPKRGGLAKRVAAGRITSQVRTSAASAGVRLKISSPYQLGAIDRGRVRHPVFGNRRAWANQSVTPGAISKPVEASKPLVRQAIQQALQNMAHKIK